MYSPVPIKRSTKFGNNYWEVYGRKVNRNVRLFSDLEYDNWIMIEGDPQVATYCEQPLLISYQLDNRVVNSIFDMWVQYLDGREVFMEVKYSKELLINNKDSERSLRQTKVQKLWCEERGFTYTIRTEKDIRQNRIFLSNMKLVISQVKNRQKPNDLYYYKIIKGLQRIRVKLSDFEDSFSSISKARMREIICWLIYEGKINCNADEVLIGDDLEVWLK
ncbi:TnsA endonuclease N-terminal domain-containing protein [Paenibacillus beijingensis]|uniref:TnsA endonuclease N-terminal domain-containing protein n=1 Tax=Paenibacillus beijingensis TaxID=1126833 RepID=A0A0D5NMR2_9BACL|nr:TnsA endonuclease N-terminal domain-containing protein [Paenibacillus beijingensis]AJY76277.1 hypothetical protein VN24_19065 [Paenibacillus beijingensis]